MALRARQMITLAIHIEGADSLVVFLRKEVIQPQVPLRLPCYDLVPITEVTFGAYPSCELARRLRVPPAFVA